MKLPEHDDVEEPAAQRRPAYEPPRITTLNQDEVLAAFQVTNASITWWIM